MRIPSPLLRVSGVLLSVCLAACAGPGTQESAQPPPAGVSSGLPSAGATASVTASADVSATASADATPPATGAASSNTAPSGVPSGQAAPSGTASAAPPPGPHIAQMASGKLGLTGYVVDIYKCPPCPPKAMCKPCMGDHVIVSEAPAPATGTRQRAPTDAVLFVDPPQLSKLAVGKKYHFEVTMMEGHLVSPALNDIKMVSASPVK